MSVRQLPTTLNAENAIVLAVAVLVTTVGLGGAAMGIGPAVGQTQDGLSEDGLETAVSLEPGSAAVDEGGTTTYEVVVADADGGVGAYDFTVDVEDSSVASITDVTAEGDPSDQTTDVSIAADGSSASVLAALADTNDTGSVTIATVTVSGDAEGTSDIGLSVEALGTEGGESYTVTETTGASITVEAADDDDDDDDSPTPEPAPADFQVSNLNAPDNATQGDAIDVSADVTNDGDEEATQSVGFRLDADGDGTLGDDEELTAQEVTLDGDEMQTVTFEDINTSGLEPGEYAHGVFTENDSATATITIEAADDDEPEPAPAPETAVGIEPGSATVDEGETTTYEVVVANADGGVGAYNLTVDVEDSSIASITEATPQGEPSNQTTEVFVADDGSSAEVVAALANTNDTGNVTVATMTVEGDDDGTSDIGLSVDALGTEAGNSYNVTETTGASITVEEDDDDDDDSPDPADFQVSNLNAPDNATQGDAIDVSADVTNDGDEEATQSVEFRLDADGDGTLDADEELTAQEVTLDGDEMQTVTFEDINTSGLDAGEYAHGVFTDDDSATATITIEAEDEADDGEDDGDDADDGEDDGDDADDSDDGDDGDDGDGDDADDGDDSADEEFSRDEIAQAKYDTAFADLSSETAAAVQAIYNRQPFPGGTDPADIRTRDEITDDRYGYDFDEVSRETRIEIQNDYDAQFGELPSDPTHTLDEIAQAKYDTAFANLSVETAAEVQAIYNRQPFLDGTEPVDIRTRDEITDDRYGYDFEEISRETRIEIQNDYDAQFGDTEG
ncbi:MULTISPECIES: hypothetical protein [Haloferacaceae]|uniref:CARDB domain-containing protein n=1 Tax=Halorubrum glutamatedens TaxID=2707018 RepID=A0ABD5QWP4_9EURY|nr:hypothetical protein [Halobellus captivus]